MTGTEGRPAGHAPHRPRGLIHADASPHTIRLYARVGERFLAARPLLASNLRRRPRRTCLKAMRTKEDGSAVRPAPSLPALRQ
jgi:hypothetical protein